ncbi:O-linked N-acetylglucosamine transferase family protein [Phreatobacter sp.]|uniref:O-linked N-acetylglucosamine transferase, SPINDLY family protein n=1 Tax=Phreatobacter sp. TaxID=1966341 RepID=UPI003F72EA9F
MSLALEWSQPLDARTRRHATDHAVRTAEMALIRGEASIAARSARQLVMAQPRISAHRDLQDRAEAALDAASDDIARLSGTADPVDMDRLAAAHLAHGDHMQAAQLWLGLARADSSRLDAFLSFAWCMVRAGNDETARPIVDHIAGLAEHPKIDALAMMLALAGDDRAAAVAHGRRAFARGSDAAVWLPMGPVFEQAGFVSDSALSLGLKLENLAAILHLYEVARAVREGRNAEAVEQADEILARVRDDHMAAMLKIIALIGMDDKVGAVKAQADLASAAGARIDTLTRLMDLLYEIEAHAEVVELGRTILERLPAEHPIAFGIAHSAAHLADLDTVDAILAALPDRLTERQKANLSPFMVLNFFDDPQLQKETASRRSRRFPAPEEPCPVALPSCPQDGPIRIGYLSNDYHNHATLKLMTEVIEATDRSRFSLTAYSYDRKREDQDRRRIAAAMDRFVDVAEMSDEEIAAQVRRDGIHVLVDLKGYTGGSRIGVLKHRLAPIQVAWLGYPGTYGMPEVDYVIADGFIIPPGAEGGYTEKVVRLPDCYQPNGRDRPSEPVPSRAEAGLPPEGFVFASFNQVYKVNTALFAAWMDILKGVPGSVLWLLAKDETTADRLRARAARHGIAADRLVFAPPLPHAQHLARYGLVDLALDTYPVGSHTTASDALWFGAPLLALAGQSFVARVSGSVLRAAGMGHLVATSFETYAAMAIAIGNDPGTSAALRETLGRTRLDVPLFDPVRFAGHLAGAYETMVDIWRSGEAPRHFDVPAMRSPEALAEAS